MTCWKEGSASLIPSLLQSERYVKHILWSFSFKYTKCRTTSRLSTNVPVLDAVRSHVALQQPTHPIDIVLPLQGSDIAQGIRATRADVVNFPTILRIPISKLITFHPSAAVILSPEAWLMSGNDLPFFPYPLNDYFAVFHGSAPLSWSSYRRIAGR
jgi:hypothetical protein